MHHLKTAYCQILFYKVILKEWFFYQEYTQVRVKGLQERQAQMCVHKLCLTLVHLCY